MSGFMTGMVVKGLACARDEEAADEVVGLGAGSALDVLGMGGLSTEVFTSWGLVGSIVGWAVVGGGMVVGC